MFHEQGEMDMAFLDKLKAKAAELGLDEKAAQAKEKAAAAAGENRGKIADVVDKAGQAVDSKTGGKYSDKIIKAQDAALKGVDKVASQSPTSDATGGPLDSGDFGTSALATERAYDADLAGTTKDDARYSTDFIGDADTSAGQDDVPATAAAYGQASDENGVERTVGQDGVGTADDQVAGESAIERAIGADATTSSLDPHTSYEVENTGQGADSSFGGTQRANQNAAGETPMRRVGDTPGE